MNERLNLQDLVDLLAQKQNITKKEAEAFLRELVAVITENIQQAESVKIKDFGTFKTILISARKSVNVNTGEDIEIAAHYKLSFSPEKSLRELVNRPFAHFESVLLEDGVSFEDISFEAAEADDEDDTDNQIDEQPALQQLSTSLSDEPQPETVPVEPSSVSDKPSIEDRISQILKRSASTAAEISVPIEPETTEDVQIISPQPEIEMPVVDVAEEPDTKSEIETELDTESQSQSPIEAEPEQPEVEPSATPDDVCESDRVIIEAAAKSPQFTADEMAEDEDGTDIRRIVLMVLAVLLIGGGVVGWFFKDQISDYLGDNRWTEDVIRDEEPLAKPSVADSLQALIADTVAVEDAIIDSLQLPVKVEVEAKEAPASKAETKVKPIAVNNERPQANIVTIQPGSTLRSIGLSVYGHKSFWVYIYQENEDKIKNPNNVPLGTKLTLPSASKYAIDRNNPESVNKAKALEIKIYKEFGIK